MGQSVRPSKIDCTNAVSTAKKWQSGFATHPKRIREAPMKDINNDHKNWPRCPVKRESHVIDIVPESWRAQATQPAQVLVKPRETRACKERARHSQTKSEEQREEKMHYRYGSCPVRKTKLVVCDTAEKFFPLLPIYL